MLDLFSGIGGFSLAASWTGGIETVTFCEIEPYCQKVLKKHWPDVPIYPDIKQLRGEDIGPVDIVCGGFPCQPFSVAGKQRGKEDDRYLWPEMFRVIRETRPSWVVGENVIGLINMELEQCFLDLEGEGYEVQSFIIPACGVEAPHQRYRVWIVAHSNGTRELQPQGSVETFGGRISNCNQDVADPSQFSSDGKWDSGADSKDIGKQWVSASAGGSGCNVAYAHKHRLEGFNEWTSSSQQATTFQANSRATGVEYWRNYWDSEPNVGRVANGIPDRVHRLKALGNSIVPQVVYPILQGIVDIERERAT